MELRSAGELGEELIATHRLVGWRLQFDGAKRRAGACRYGQRVISLSAPLTRLHDEAEVRETVLHEVAHALAGPGAGHGPEWQRIARSIGSTAERCVPGDAPRLPGHWVGVCPGGHLVERHRRPERVTSCRTCVDGFSLEHLLEWTFRGRPASMHPNYVAELESLQRGVPMVRLGPGRRVRITAPGEFHGRTGVVVRRGRTSYHVRVREGLLRVVFAGVEAA